MTSYKAFYMNAMREIELLNKGIERMTTIFNEFSIQCYMKSVSLKKVKFYKNRITFLMFSFTQKYSFHFEITYYDITVHKFSLSPESRYSKLLKYTLK